MLRFVKPIEDALPGHHVQFWAKDLHQVSAHVALARLAGVGEREPFWHAGNGALPEFKWGAQTFSKDGRWATEVIWTTPDAILRGNDVPREMARLMADLLVRRTAPTLHPLTHRTDKAERNRNYEHE